MKVTRDFDYGDKTLVFGRGPRWNRPHRQCAMMVTKELRELIMDIRIVSDRVRKLRREGWHLGIKIFRRDETVYKFWKQP